MVPSVARPVVAGVLSRKSSSAGVVDVAILSGVGSAAVGISSFVSERRSEEASKAAVSLAARVAVADVLLGKASLVRLVGVVHFSVISLTADAVLSVIGGSALSLLIFDIYETVRRSAPATRCREVEDMPDTHARSYHVA